MKKNYLIFLIILLLACSCKNLKKEISKDQLIPPSPVAEKVGKISDFQYELIFKVKNYKHFNQYTISGIKILNKDKNCIHQVLEGFTSVITDLNDKLIIEDVNFDGFPDIRLTQYIPVTNEIPYYYWTYNPEKNQFERNMEFEKLTSPVFDHDSKIISSVWRQDAFHFGTSYYKYNNNSLVLIKEKEEIYDDYDKKKIIEKELIDGKLVTVSYKNTSVD